MPNPFDVREFENACRDVIDEFDKDAPVYLNRQMLAVVIGSANKKLGKKYPGLIQLTPRAARTAIKDVPRVLVFRVVLARLKRAGKPIPAAEDFDSLVDKEINRRFRAIGYAAGPGWFNAAKAFGGNPGGKNKPSSTSNEYSFNQGYGSDAAKNRLFAEIANATPGAYKHGNAALTKAFSNIAQDMRDYGSQALLEKNFGKHSGKK